MAELIAVGFQGTHRAAEVLDQLQRLNAKGIVGLDDAVAVYRTHGGRLRVDRSMYLTTKEEVAWGGVVGAFVGALLALPVAALAAVPAAAAALGIGGAAIGATSGVVMSFDEAVTWKETFGVSDEFVKEVGGLVQPGQSAVFMLARADNPAAAVEKFRGFGGKVLRTTLRAEQTRRLAETLQSAS